MATEGEDDGPVRVYIDLIGDLFHWGHIRQLERARAVGDVLVVGVLGDEDAEALSHRPVATLAERCAVIAACRHADEIVPAAPPAFDEAFLDRYGIDYACLSDDFGNEARQAAFAALADGGRGVVLPYGEDISTAALVERIVGRAESGLDLPRAPPLAVAPVIHPPPDEAGKGLAELRAGQAALLQGLGALAAHAFGAPGLLVRDAAQAGPWAALAEAHAAADLARNSPDRDDFGAAAERIARIEAAVPPGDRLVLLGAQSTACAHALAGRRGAITVLDPVGRRPSAEGGGVDVVRCDWPGLAAACPETDALAVLDAQAAAWLLADRMALWHLAERVRDRLLLVAPLGPEARHGWRASGKGDGFVFSDSFVRGALHEARFFEVADTATLVDGVPAAGDEAATRVSRFTYRESLEHAPRLRFLDGERPRALRAGRNAAIRRWYIARKGPLPGSDEAG